MSWRSSRSWWPAEPGTADRAMSAHILRREADVARLRELVARSGGRIELLEASTRSGAPIRLAIRCRTAGSSAYPQSQQDEVRLRIDLPSRYPFERPVLTVEGRIFHPNVFASGVICQGEKWLAGEGLDLLVKRTIRLAGSSASAGAPAAAAAMSAKASAGRSASTTGKSSWK